ncbi:ABC transporter substrate-binding protein [Planococcus salinarum]|uniref:ABC transporter substrate-binding protein n=1 Tax=Planococcus salinarum TaxID=622695 RepID=UPI000E3DE7E4|nr:ABC transporter substrate-binding protein [Planococcus salinarum]TAA73413.1 ABC transporter substrate-binding protein [Planococcus salinarum]
MKKWMVVFGAAFAMAGCTSETPQEGGSGDESELEKVTMVLDWTPNTNHTGLYAAQAEGYFEERGLDVEIIMPGETGADQLVASGKADFGIGAQESLTEARVADIPIVSIAAIIQHNTSGFASPADKNITSPADYEGKTYGGWGAPVEKAVIASLMEQEGADVEKVEFLNMGNTDFFTAVERDVDFAWIYYGWTGIEAELRGEELNMQYLTDYSEKLDYYTPVLTTNEEMIAEDPDTVRAFTAAVAEGYQFAIDNPGEAADILISAVPDLDAELVRASQEWLSPKYQADASRWGEQDTEVWADYANWMNKNGLLDGEFEVQEAFTNNFLPEGESE